ncbi:MAG: hypothetical protein KC800_10015 [Candidatus Eremiobacteraeota bacterium]|nr:hypothetical protein [Candidatus Eremiobacteraeota bacterium]
MSTMLKKHRGVALFVVMITTLVLALMMGAFFKAYQSHFALTRSGNASQRAGSACDSVYQYICYRLEHDRTWGSEEFADSGKGDPMGETLNVTEETGTHRFTGSIKSLDATFEGEVYNNLSGSASGDVVANAQPGTLLCKVTAHSGESTRNAEFVLRVAPLFDSSVLSRSQINVNAEKLNMRSRDANRNMLRSEGNIYVPDILSGKDTQFLQPDSNNADDKGMLWSKGEIHSYLGLGGPTEAIDTAEELKDAVTNSNGKIVAGADSDFSIFDLDQSNLQLPESNSEVPLRLDGKDKPGRWNFIRRKADVSYTATYVEGGLETTRDYDEQVWVDVLEYYPPGSDTPTDVYRAQNRTDDLMAQTPGTVEEKVKARKRRSKTVELELDGVVTNDVSLPDYPGVDVTLLSEDALVFKSDDGKASFTFDLMNQSVTATHNATVTVNGPFEVTSETDPTAVGVIAETPPPILDLGYQADTSVEGGVAKAALVAEGTLNIENGITTGLGALISKTGDVKIQPINTDTVTVDAGNTGSGLLIFAGENVVLKNPDEASSWLFKGLVYARDGIRMEGHGQDATFEGTIVSLQDSDPTVDPTTGEASPDGIEFVDCGQIEFIYNSELLDAYVRNLPGDRIQVELVYWKR